MEIPAHRPPRSAITGTGTGLFMMAFFTLLWGGIAFAGLGGTAYRPLLLILVICCIVFVIYGVKFFQMAKLFPEASSPEDVAREKSTGKWFGIIFGAEGLGIFIAINIVINIGHPELQIPAIALVVGLHFFPLARVFHRNIDYYFASYSTIVAIVVMYLAVNKTLDEPQIFAFTGIGIALATIGYGIYMISEGKRLKAKYVNP